VEERCEEVGVVNFDRELDEDVLVAETGLLESITELATSKTIWDKSR
jgi:hypothetical protein